VSINYNEQMLSHLLVGLTVSPTPSYIAGG